MKRHLTAAYVCLLCRKVFKRASHRLVGTKYEELDYAPVCPQCKTVSVKVGDAFRAPPKEDVTAWEKIEQDLSRGRKFERDEGFGRKAQTKKRKLAPKGIHSLFQLPGRKRRAIARNTASKA